MGFAAILRKTLIDLTGWKRTLTLMVLGLFLPVITGIFWRFELENAGLSPEMETYVVVKHFIGISFIWTAGLFLAMAVVTSAAGALSKEAGDGTLLTLVSKPISRRQIVLGKFAAIVVHALLMMAIILLTQAVLLWFMLPVDAPTFAALLAAVPWILLYSLLVILVFSSISLAMSSLIDNQVAITVLACGVVLFMFLFGPISSIFGLHSESYENNHIYLMDGSYQLGNAFAPALEQALGGEMLPANELNEIRIFTGIFGGNRWEEYYPWEETSEYQYPGELANYVRPWVSVVLLMVLTAGSLAVAVVMTERKDVG